MSQSSECLKLVPPTEVKDQTSETAQAEVQKVIRDQHDVYISQVLEYMRKHDCHCC